MQVVFDTAAKINCICLNDAIHQGPKLQKDLYPVLTRFQKYQIALACNLAEMYLRIELVPQDQKRHCFLWRNMYQTKQPDLFKASSLVFRVNSAPFEAQFVSQEYALDLKGAYSLAADTILNSTYVDDNMDSVADEKSGVKLHQELSILWEKVNIQHAC